LREGSVRRAFFLAGVSTFVLNLIGFGAETVPLRPDNSRAALADLGREYGNLQIWASAIAQATDTLTTENSEPARMLAHHLAKLIRPLEKGFEETTAALSTEQLELVLPLWERMAFAHAGFALLQEEASALGGDPALEPAELHELVSQLSAVLDFASEIQRMVLDQLSAPLVSPFRIS
jgi:hypothetical protein